MNFFCVEYNKGVFNYIVFFMCTNFLITKIWTIWNAQVCCKCSIFKILVYNVFTTNAI